MNVVLFCFKEKVYIFTLPVKKSCVRRVDCIVEITVLSSR